MKRSATRSPSPIRRLVVLAALGLALFMVPGCFNPFSPLILGRARSEKPPEPSTPEGLLKLFAWAYNQRDYEVYRKLFTEDYRFVFAANDTAGRAYTAVPWTYGDENEYSRHLFQGGDGLQPASSITLVLDNTFQTFPDSRRDPLNPDLEHFVSIRTSVTLNITDVDGVQTNVSGQALFYLVRGDSARIPEGLGLEPSASRWYINRWEDQTTPSSLMASASSATRADPIATPGATLSVAELPARRGRADVYNATWGLLKRFYR
ncbi:MAG: hypothetical protein HOP12_00075 [Candidatus Eisenbacteria bacterium]|uniref:Uncharacterized protein n=1 Tax=Eiseniibacteriota bacterium TaxID=2212470 RepID=A0A849STH3_UNCEI|nr:hypothetical protein [Candidatus Eisenbacteria bacterium]